MLIQPKKQNNLTRRAQIMKRIIRKISEEYTNTEKSKHVYAIDSTNIAEKYSTNKIDGDL